MKKKRYGITKSLAALAVFVLAFVLLLAPQAARAQQATNGQNGGNASSSSNGGNGANGSDGVLFVGVSSVAGGTFTAGNGGNGGSGADLLHSGGKGGNGGNAAVAQPGSTVTVTGGTFKVGSNGSAGAGSRGGASGPAGYDLLANGGAITVYGYGFSPGSVGPSLTGSGTLTATIGGVTQTLSYSVSSAAGSALFLKNSGTLATTTGLTVSPSPSVAGQLVTLTAAVTSSGGMPTGSVTFQLGNATLGTVLLTNGTATFTTHGLPLGSDTLTAYYTGDSSFALSNGSFVQTVMPTSTDVVAEFLGGPEIPATSNSGYFGQSFTTITASPVTNIAFSFEAAPYSTASPYALGTAYLLSLPYTGLPSGLSSQTPGFLGVTTASGGVYNFGASVTLQPHTQYFLYENVLFPNDAIYGGGQYAGGTVYYALPSSLPPRFGNNPFIPDLGSNSACFLVTGVPLLPPYATTTALTPSVNPSFVGQSVTFTAAVTSNGGTPTGTVQFAIDGANVGGPTTLGSSGQATDTETALTPGTHAVTVTYAPTSAFTGNAGATLTQTVNPLTLTTTLASSANPSLVGQSVTFTAAVASNGPAPTGPVQFAIDGVSVGGPVMLNAAGQATDTETGLAVDAHTVTATYTHTGTFTGSTVATITQTVNPLTLTTTLASSNNPSVVGQSVTFTAAVASNGSTPTGAVQFAVDGVSVGGPVTLNASGKATDTETSLALGTHHVTVTYATTLAFTGSTAAALDQVVNPHVSPQYVSPSGSDSGDGSQAGPKQTIQSAVNATLSGDTVIVENGTYSGAGNRDIDFGGRNIIVQSAGGDPSKTIIDCGGSSSASHRGFFFHSGETGAVISGLTVQNGYENGPNSASTDPTGCGGAVAVASGSTVTLTNCILTGNRSICGGGVYNDGTLALTDCALTGNIMSGNYYDGGGGLYNLGTVSAADCTFTNNSADGYGGGITNSGPAVFSGCTITGNSATPQGGGLFNNGSLTLTDDIVYGDAGGEVQYDAGTAAVTYCDVQGGYAGTGNIDADPLFVNAAAGDFHLKPGSPCLGAGASAGAPATDKDGHTRPNPPGIGAYERAVGGAAGHTHLLWTNANGTAALWTIYLDGTVTSTPALGPLPGWTARAIADGADGRTRLLWTRSDGMNSVWTVNPADGSYTSTPGYGPIPGWNVAALSVGPDDLARLEWRHSPDGQSSVWTIAGNGSYTSTPGFGPYGPWTAGPLAVGGDSLSRLLWGDGAGHFSVWTLDALSNVSSTPAFGPIPGWAAGAIAGGPDLSARLLLNRSDGGMAVWTVSGAGVFTSTPLYGPIPSWYCHGLAVGPDGLSHVLWSRSDGMSSVWTINGDSSFTSTPGYGPYNGWSAVGLATGP